MINNANKHTIADIFMVDNQVKYVIPKFQREYTWSKDNWEELITDIIESDGSHFIGSIICINQGSNSLSPELELIDGQQRLTTISLLFCAIYKLLKDKGPQDNEDFKLDLGNLKWKLVQRRSGDLKLEPSRQNNNLSDYKSVLDEIGIFEYSDHVNNRGNRKIYKCFRFFTSKLEDYSIDELSALLEKITKTLLVKIEVDSHSDAFMLFESLNNRGIPLSAIDLIKNKILAELENKKITSADNAFEKWNAVINNLSDYSIQERFLRQYYNAFKYKKESIKVEGASKATRSNLIKIYETLISRDPEFIFDEIIKKSSIYHDLIFPEDAEGGIFIELKKELVDLVNVKAAPAYTLLLYLFSYNTDLDIDFYRSVINFLVKYFIRRNFTDFPNTRNLDQIFTDLIEVIEKNGKPTSQIIIDFLSDKDRTSSIDTFRERLGGDVYEMNIDATRFVLSKIEERKKTKEIYLDFWARDNSDKLVWTIEHVFPEGKNIPESWIQAVASGDRNAAKEIQEQYVHKIGNLTLTGYNSNLSNFDFDKKRDREKNGNYIGYRNGLFLNEDLKDKETWTKEDIIARTEKLIDLAVEVFSFDNE